MTDTARFSAPPGRASRNVGLVLTLAAVVVYGLLALSGPRGIQALVEKHREIRQLQEQNAALDSENKARKEKIERLANSRDEQGLVIRKQRKQVRPGEKTYVIQDEPAQTPANP